MRRLSIAHRAGNDLETLRSVEDLGVDLVEADVHLYRGRIEVRHLKTAGPIPLLWDRWLLANPFAPRLLLGELLGHVGPRTELMLDLKGRGRRVATAVLAEWRHLHPGRPLTICSRNWRHLAPIPREPGLRVIYSIGSRRQLRRFLRRFAPGAGLDGVSIHQRLLDPPAVDALGDRAGVIMTWAVRDAARADELRRAGVNGLITEDRELLTRWRHGEGAPARRTD